jgi:hypothetical protein
MSRCLTVALCQLSVCGSIIATLVRQIALGIFAVLGVSNRLDFRPVEKGKRGGGRGTSAATSAARACKKVNEKRRRRCCATVFRNVHVMDFTGNPSQLFFTAAQVSFSGQRCHG